MARPFDPQGGKTGRRDERCVVTCPVAKGRSNYKNMRDKWLVQGGRKGALAGHSAPDPEPGGTMRVSRARSVESIRRVA
jgi:hypothetical protein